MSTQSVRGDSGRRCLRLDIGRCWRRFYKRLGLRRPNSQHAGAESLRSPPFDDRAGGVCASKQGPIASNDVRENLDPHSTTSCTNM